MNKPAHILILGAGVMQIPAIRIAVEMGLKVTVADGSPDAPGISLAHSFLHIDLKEKEKIADAAKKLMPGVDGVFTAGTDFSYSVAWIADSLDLPGITLETAAKATDKALMRECFKEHDVPSPKFLYIDTSDDKTITEKLLEDLSFPLVVKPVDNMGSRGIRRVDTLSECVQAVEDAFSLSMKGRVIIEEFIEGDEYSIDALVWDDKIYICGIADRHIFFPPYFIEMGHTMPSCADESVKNEIINVFKAGIKSLGITRGAAKGDIKCNSRGAFVGEIAARLSGGYMSGWTYPYAAGIHPARGGINIALGIPPFSSFSPGSWYSAERAYISVPGTVKSVSGESDALSALYIKNHFPRVRSGDKVVFPRNNVEKCGNYISQAPERTLAVEAAESACRNMFIELVPDDPDTFRFLTGRGVQHFTFPVTKEVLGACRNMPLFQGDPSFEESKVFTVQRNETVLNYDALSWHGESVDNQIRRCYRMGIQEASTGFAIGGPFWLSFIRGGVQGAIWFRDTFGYHKKQGDWQDWLKSWYV